MRGDFNTVRKRPPARDGREYSMGVVGCQSFALFCDWALPPALLAGGGFRPGTHHPEGTRCPPAKRAISAILPVIMPNSYLFDIGMTTGDETRTALFAGR